MLVLVRLQIVMIKTRGGSLLIWH